MFNIPYSILTIFAILILFILTYFLFYFVSVATKAFQKKEENKFVNFIVYFFLLFISFIPSEIIDPQNLWFNWIFLWNPMIDVLMILKSILKNDYVSLSFYLPSIISIIALIISPFFWKYVYWLKA